MKRVVINALLAFILMLIQTSVASSFGLLSVCQFGILASVVSSALAFPTMSTSISMLLLGLAFEFVVRNSLRFEFDLWVSGPPFLYAFLFVIAHLVASAIIGKIRTERPVFVILYATMASAFFDLLQCVAYSLFYREGYYWDMFPRVVFVDAIWAAVWAAPYMWGVLALDRIIVKRRAGRLS